MPRDPRDSPERPRLRAAPPLPPVGYLPAPPGPAVLRPDPGVAGGAARVAVLAYGTLQPGFAYEGVAARAGAEVGPDDALEGIDLFDLAPEGYPAAVPGTGTLHGRILRVPVAGLALLDELEGVEDAPPLYARVLARTVAGRDVRVYLYLDGARLRASGAARVASGRWRPGGAVDGAPDPDFRNERD